MQNKDSLKGQVIIVTGGASGIGKEAAKALNQLGARVVVADFNVKGAEEVASMLSKNGSDAKAYQIDVSKAEDESKDVKANLDRFDKLDFDAYSKKKGMKLFEKIHCPDVKVVFPDGRTTIGIEQHLKDIETFFNGTPDARISDHPIAFGSGD